MTERPLTEDEIDAAAELRQRELVCELMTFSTPKSEREWAIVRYIHQLQHDMAEDHLPFHRALMRIAYDAKTLQQAQEWGSQRTEPHSRGTTMNTLTSDVRAVCSRED